MRKDDLQTFVYLTTKLQEYEGDPVMQFIYVDELYLLAKTLRAREGVPFHQPCPVAQ